MMSRRKARRSEHLKWIIDNKKMSTVSRFERRDHSNSNRIGRITSVERVRAEPENFVFKDINLATILSERAEKEQVITLEDAF